MAIIAMLTRGGHSHDVEDNSDGRGDEHDGGVYLVVATLDPLHCRVDQHSRDHPQHQDRHQRSQDFCRGETQMIYSIRIDTSAPRISAEEKNR